MNYKVPFMFGKVKEVDPDGEGTTIITFCVPGVIDNMTQYPKAYPIGNHTHKISKGDSVFITRVSDLDRFFYQPLDFSEFLGLKSSNKNYIELKGDDKLTITVDGKEVLTVGKNESTQVLELTIAPMALGDDSTPLCNMAFTCPNCLMTGAPHGGNKVKLLGA